MMRAAVALALLGALNACTVRFAGEKHPDWERNAIDAKAVAPEANVSLPPYPQQADLIEFFPGPVGSHRYFIDEKTLVVGADGIVRYTVMLKSAGGATNVAHEGIRCLTKEKRIYALGHPGGKWIEAKRSSWEPIVATRAHEYQATLYSDYFCRDRFNIADRDTAVRALRSGLRRAGGQGE